MDTDGLLIFVGISVLTVIANPPGLGKTLTAIAFALIWCKLGIKDALALFVIKKLVAHQFVKECQRFVDVSTDELRPARDRALSLLNLTALLYQEKLVSQDYTHSVAWNLDLFVFVSNKSSSKSTNNKLATNSHFPLHGSHNYGLLLYNKVHNFLVHTAQLFTQEFSI